MPTLRRVDLPMFHHHRIMTREVHDIAGHVAARLDGVGFDGPEVRDLIVRAALASPGVRTQRQAREVALGFEGRTMGVSKGARYVRHCRLAGRQLQFMLSVLPGVL